MKYTKTIKDYRGTVEIEIKLHTFPYYNPDKSGNFYRYDVLVWHTANGLRKPLQDGECATEAEILQAKNELWEKIKPS